MLSSPAVEASGKTPAGSRQQRLIVLVPLLVCAVLVAIMAFQVFRPFFLDLTVAGSVALLLAPLQRRFTSLVRGRASLAAALLVLLVTVTILLPVLSSAALLGQQAFGFFDWLSPRLRPDALESLWRDTLPDRYPRLAPWFKASGGGAMPLVSDALSRFAAGANNLIQKIVSGLTSAALELVLFLLILFFFLRDGPRFREEVRKVSPISESQEGEILEHLTRTIKGVLQAMVVVPVVQGLVAMLGFWLFGVPSPLLWGVMVIFAAFIPLLGSPLGWVPAAVYLIVTRPGMAGWGLLAYGVFFISTIDNFVKPWLLREAAQIHPLLGFLSILGGVVAFGPMGFLVGPVILSLLLSALRIYRLDFLHPDLRSVEQSSPSA
jgi:predicted PurR-regulated permease PerM